MLQYYRVLRSVIHENPALRRRLTKCRHCRIFFLTHPRNAGRTDIRCPFGCRQGYRKKSAIKRSVEYYRSPWGKDKKKLQNSKRFREGGSGNGIEDSANGGSDAHAEGFLFDEATVRYIRTVVSLIEGRSVSMDEILALLIKISRQHSIGKGKKLLYPDKRNRGDPK